MRRVERDALILVFSARIVVSQVLKKSVKMLTRIATTIEPAPDDRVMEAIAWRGLEKDAGKRIDDAEWHDRRFKMAQEISDASGIISDPVVTELGKTNGQEHGITVQQLFAAFSTLKQRGFDGTFEEASEALGIPELDTIQEAAMRQFWGDLDVQR